MLRLVAGVICAAALVGCQTAPAERAPFYTLIDLTDEYAAFYDRTEGMPPDQRIAAFKTTFDAAFPGFYDAGRLAEFGVSAAQYDTMISSSFDRFPSIRPQFSAVSGTFNTMMAGAQHSFINAFPDAQPIGQVYLLHSLGEMDGGTRTISGVNHLIFGADVIAQVDHFADAQPFFHHELFHVYHSQFFADCDQVWCGLWREGLAVYVAKNLNPTADDDELLLTHPQPLRAFYDAHTTQAICAVRAALDTTNNAPFFSGGRSAEGLPPRIGYLVGYMVAQQAGRTRSLRQLAHLSVAKARPLVNAALAALATCPPN